MLQGGHRWPACRGATSSAGSRYREGSQWRKWVQPSASADAQPPFGPTPAPLSGKELPSFKYALGAQSAKAWDGGWSKEATVAEFPVSEKLAGVLMQLSPGALRELHWHANAAEWAYVIKGRCRVTTIDPQGHSEIVDFDAGDVWYFPRGHGHSIQGLGPGRLPVPPRLRQRLLLRVRHLQHHGLAGSHAPRGAGQELRRAGFDLRRLPQARGLHGQRARAAAAAVATPRPARSTSAPSRTATACWPSGPRGSPAARCGWSRSASSRSPRP